jgi:hypothetical protein
MAGHPSPSLSPGPADRARYFLIDHWPEPDAYVAKLADCGTTTARRARLELESLGAIPHREPDLSEDAWRPGRTWHDAAGKREGLSPHQRACLELEADPHASDQRLSDRASCSHTVVRDARRELEAAGVIDVIPASERERRTLDGQRLDTWHATELPPMPPELRQGLCLASPDPDLWLASTDPARRAEAISTCHACPALHP